VRGRPRVYSGPCSNLVAFASCPGCHGTGRKTESEGFRDVTKTKPSHHRPANQPANQPKQQQQGPSTPAGLMLVKEVEAGGLATETKAKLTREIIEHEAVHGLCTQTFIKKVRKQLRPA
jgi:hypothetical protein